MGALKSEGLWFALFKRRNKQKQIHFKKGFEVDLFYKTKRMATTLLSAMKTANESAMIRTMVRLSAAAFFFFMKILLESIIEIAFALIKQQTRGGFDMRQTIV